MSGPDPIGEALAALNSAFTVTTAAIDVGSAKTAAAFHLGPEVGTSILALINAVLAEKDAADLAAFKRKLEQWTAEMTPEPTPEDVLTCDAYRPRPSAPDILDTIAAAFHSRIEKARSLRQHDGATGDYLREVAHLAAAAAPDDNAGMLVPPSLAEDLATMRADTREALRRAR